MKPGFELVIWIRLWQRSAQGFSVNDQGDMQSIEEFKTTANNPFHRTVNGEPYMMVPNVAMMLLRIMRQVPGLVMPIPFNTGLKPYVFVPIIILKPN